MANKINYYNLSKKVTDKINYTKIKPTICLHSCCGPCSTFPIVYLSEYFSKICIIYNNSNIYPSEEYNRRLDELKRYINEFNKTNNIVELIEIEYKNDEYNEFLKTYGPVKEGGSRCFACYEKRMDEAYKIANELGYDYFTTVMTISRQKNSQVLNEIGEKLSKKYQTKYFFSDFKKKNGIDIRNEIVRNFNMYNQQYCGCIYSYNDYLNRKKDDKKE